MDGNATNGNNSNNNNDNLCEMRNAVQTCCACVCVCVVTTHANSPSVSFVCYAIALCQGYINCECGALKLVKLTYTKMIWFRCVSFFSSIICFCLPFSFKKIKNKNFKKNQNDERKHRIRIFSQRIKSTRSGIVQDRGSVRNSLPFHLRNRVAFVGTFIAREPATRKYLTAPAFTHYTHPFAFADIRDFW